MTIAAHDEIERLRAHSITLNTIAWKIATALGDVPEGAEQISGDPVEQTDRLIAEVERLRAEVALADREDIVEERTADYLRDRLAEARAEVERLKNRGPSWAEALVIDTARALIRELGTDGDDAEGRACRREIAQAALSPGQLDSTPAPAMSDRPASRSSWPGDKAAWAILDNRNANGGA